MPKFQHQCDFFADDEFQGLTNRHGCYLLYALQHWESIKQPADGPYGPGLFYKHVSPILKGLANIGRRTVLHHLSSPQCLGCQTPVDLAKSVLDHIMPVSQGGPETVSNALVLCRRCNSSKGAKDLLEWWAFRGAEVAALPRQALCLYARIYWQYAEPCWHEAVLLPTTQQFLDARMQGLPSGHHRVALFGAAHLGLAQWRASHLLSSVDLAEERQAVADFLGTLHANT